MMITVPTLQVLSRDDDTTLHLKPPRPTCMSVTGREWLDQILVGSGFLEGVSCDDKTLEKTKQELFKSKQLQKGLKYAWPWQLS